MLAAREYPVGQRTRSRIAPFRLHRPSSVDEAVELMAGAPPGAVYMAGGIDLINTMKAGGNSGDVVHLGHVSELASITMGADGVRIGACATHQEIARNPLVKARAPDLAALWNTLGNPRIRCKGTLGGNIMAREPTYDVAATLMALGATLTIALPAQTRRQIPAAELAAAEGLLVSADVPGNQRVRLLIDRSLRPVVSLAIGLHFDEGYIIKVLVALACAFAEPRVWPLAVSRNLAPAELSTQAALLADAFTRDMPQPMDDWRASGEYRRRMTGILLRRLLSRAGECLC
jgi:aerobic carbon-monoxide dehydrogenase medium subunit